MWNKFFETNENLDEQREINFTELYKAIENIEMEEIKNVIDALIEKVSTLEIEVQRTQPTKIEEHKGIAVTIAQPNDVSLEIFKTLPVFDGEREKYPTWRSMAHTAIKLLDGHSNSMRYYEALMIIRNKITGPASNVLNNYNTVFNFDAIIDRLDFTYAERPIYILEQELLMLQQHKLSIDEFFDRVNEKLNCIINKINMTHKQANVANALIDGANEKALRTFITGLNNRRGELLYASNPRTLPDAYARLQTIVTDQERINFANRYNYRERDNQIKNPNFKYRERQERQDRSWYGNQIQNHQNSKRNDEPEPMEVDKSSTRVNVERPSTSNRFSPQNKREVSKQNTQRSSDQKMKHQRFNNIQDYAKTIIDDKNSGDESDDEFCAEETASNISRSSIFLDN